MAKYSILIFVCVFFSVLATAKNYYVALTGIKVNKELNTRVFVNAANQITIIAPEKSNYAIYNTMGQEIENGILNTKLKIRCMCLFC
jgi:hypothetical protein